MARHRRRHARLSRSALIFGIAAAIIGGGASSASAHPLGQKPVAIITPADDGLNISWVLALDDAKSLITSLGLGPIRAESIGEQPAFRAYFLRRVQVRTDARACAGVVTGSVAVSNGVAVGSSFDCGARVERASITLTLLQDLSEDYITLYRATVPGGNVKGAFAVGASTLALDLRPGATPVATPSTDERRPEGRTARIVAMLQGQAGAASFAFALVLALVLGAVHAITPGHGKTITAAYIVGAGGTLRQALALGGVVAGTHALSVAALGAIAVALDRLVLPREMGPWLEIATGALVVGLGVSLLRARPHRHGHDDHHDQTGAHEPTSEAPVADPLPLRRLAAIGFVGGLVPSPEAIGIVLVAFTLERWVAGMLLVVAFSLGLAAVVLGIAALAVRGASLLRRASASRLASFAPRVAAAIFLLMGVILAVNGVRRI